MYYIRIVFIILVNCSMQLHAVAQNPCNSNDWGPLLSNDCGDIQASGGLAPGSPVIFCEGQTILVENNSSPMADIQNTYINWGDGLCETFNGFQANATHAYDFPNDTCILNVDGTIVFNIRLGVEKSCSNGFKSFNFVTFPIKVRFKPIANFNVSPQVACVNQPIDFNNTSCDNTNNPMFLWNMGDGMTFTTEDINNYLYSMAGSYSVTMSVTNSCGTDQITKVVTMTPPATADAIPVDPLICAGQTVTFTNLSTNNTGNFWQVSPSAGTQFVSPTNSGSVNPIIRFNNPGTYTVTLNVIGCGSPQWMGTVTVLAPASINIATIPDQCAIGSGVTITPTGTVGGTNPVVDWTFPGGTPSTFTGNTPGPIDYPAQQAQYIITATATNLCNVATDSDTFNIAPPATAVFSLSSADICGPDSILTLTNTSTNSNNNFTWTITPNSGFIFTGGTNANSTNPALQFTQENTYTIRLDVNACGSPFATNLVLVRLRPIVTQIDMIADGCTSLTINPLSYVSFGGGMPDSIVWTFGGGNIGSFVGANPPMVTFSSTGTHFISATATNACGTSAVADTFQIFAFENVALSPVDPVCNAATPFQLQATPPNGAWSGPGVSINGIFTPANAQLNQVNQLIYRLNPGSSCEVRDTLFILVQGTVVDAGSDLNLCSNANPVSLSATPSGGMWSGENISSGVVFDPTTATASDYVLTYMLTDTVTGCSNKDSIAVHILSIPTATLDSIGRTCVGEALDLGPFSGGTGISSCQWEFGDGNTSNVCDPIHIYANPGIYVLTLMVQNAAMCKDTVSTVIQVVTPPDATFTIDTTSGCADLPVTIFNTSTINDYTLYIWQYGNGVQDTVLQPGTIVFTQGEHDTTYTILLQSVNGCGTATFSEPVTVFPRPQVRFGTDVSSGCTPLEVNFNNVSVGDPDYYRWYVNGVLRDTSFQLGQQVFLTTDHDSTYIITLVAGNECGMDTVIHTVLVKPNPVEAFFNIDTLSGCQPLAVRLIDYSTQGLYVSWDLGDGNTATGDTVLHTFLQAGIYLIREFVNNGCGFDTASVTVTVLPTPVVSFSHEAFVCLGDTIYFYNTSPAVIGSYWDFGDGTADSTLTTTFHIYTNPGQYIVQMVGLAATTGCQGSASSTVEVKDLPQLAISLPDTFGCQPFTIHPVNTTPGNPLFYTWNFGDGSTSTSPNGQHTYSSPGAYSIYAQITDFFGCTNTWSYQPIQVYPKPVASFLENQTELCLTPTTLLFHNTSVDADAYQWQFGALGISTEVDPTLDVNTSGIIPVVLFAENQYGCKDTVARDVSVYGTPMPIFMVDDQEGCEPFSVFFENQSTGVNQYAWQFGDGALSNEISPIHVYEMNGTYTVTLFASADSICFDSVRFNNLITVLPSPVADFSFEPVNDTTITPNGIIRFTDLSLGAVRWHWDFGDGDTSAQRNPTHRYFVNGPRPVQLITYNHLGCSDTATMNITPEFFGRLYIPTALSPESGTAGELEFIAVGLGLLEFDLSVYASNGQRVWHTAALLDGQPSEGWNGRLNNTGPELPPGVYLWKARARFENGQIWDGMSLDGNLPVTEGKVLLIR